MQSNTYAQKQTDLEFVEFHHTTHMNYAEVSEVLGIGKTTVRNLGDMRSKYYDPNFPTIQDTKTITHYFLRGEVAEYVKKTKRFPKANMKFDTWAIQCLPALTAADVKVVGKKLKRTLFDNHTYRHEEVMFCVELVFGKYPSLHSSRAADVITKYLEPHTWTNKMGIQDHQPYSWISYTDRLNLLYSIELLFCSIHQELDTEGHLAELKTKIGEAEEIIKLRMRIAAGQWDYKPKLWWKLMRSKNQKYSQFASKLNQQVSKVENNTVDDSPVTGFRRYT